VVKQVEQQADAATPLGTIELNTLETGFVFQEQEDLYAEKEKKQKEFRENKWCPPGQSYYHALQ